MQALRKLSNVARRFGTASEATLEKTALYDLHLEKGGKMVPFAGYSLPVQYPEGVLKSHLHTRAKGCASLFDVGHMGQIRWHGKDRAEFLESLIVADVAEMKEGDAKLTLLTNAAGGIIDDSVLTNHGKYIYMVVNGATKYGDMAHFDAHLSGFKSKGKEVSYEYLHSQNLVALQGDAAPQVLARLVAPEDREAVQKMRFMTGRPMKVLGIDGCIVTRCGYTGEDGYEVSVPYDSAVKVATAMLDQKEVLPAGLGARDSLRLEAGLCLYGHDIDERITPGEAVLAWTIGKRRKEQGGFLGSDIILKQIKEKSWKQRRVGLSINGAPAREGTKIFTADGASQIGHVSSGTFSPCLKAPIAMGYVATEFSELGKQVAVEVRGKMVPATVAKMPFVPNNYYKPA